MRNFSNARILTIAIYINSRPNKKKKKRVLFKHIYPMVFLLKLECSCNIYFIVAFGLANALVIWAAKYTPTTEGLEYTFYKHGILNQLRVSSSQKIELNSAKSKQINSQLSNVYVD